MVVGGIVLDELKMKKLDVDMVIFDTAIETENWQQNCVLRLAELLV